jgi:Rnl2 family RNA ligase
MYPHPDVKPNPNIKLPIQRGVWYSPNIHFFAFDIKLFPKGGFLGYDEACGYFEECGFMYSKPIVRGTFNEVYSFDVEKFTTRVPISLGLPEIPENYAEGIVLKPVVHTRTAKNDRVILKKKHSAFREKVEGVAPNPKGKKKNPTKPIEELPDTVTKLSAEIIRFINVNRLRGLVSKMGRPESGSKAFNEFVAAFAKDILDDFRKEHGVEFETLEKPMQKKITSYMNGVMTRFLRDNWDATVSGTL